MDTQKDARGAEDRSCEDTARRQPSASRGEQPWEQPNLLDPGLLASRAVRIHACCLNYQVSVDLPQLHATIGGDEPIARPVLCNSGPVTTERKGPSTEVRVAQVAAYNLTGTGHNNHIYRRPKCLGIIFFLNKYSLDHLLKI